MNVVQRKSQKFPLSFHKGSGQWCKKHRGQTYYFGNDQAMALARYAKEWDGIINHGKQIHTRPDGEGATLDEICFPQVEINRECAFIAKCGKR